LWPLGAVPLDGVARQLSEVLQTKCGFRHWIAVPKPPRSTMLLTTPAGSTYTVPELAAMLTAAGFGSPEVTPLVPTPLALLVARAL
jgi:hypothetical protein